MGINEEDCKSFGNERKVTKLWIINLQFKLKKKTNKQSNLLILTVSCKKSCQIRRKKWINNNNNIKTKKKKRKRDQKINKHDNGSNNVKVILPLLNNENEK